MDKSTAIQTLSIIIGVGGTLLASVQYYINLRITEHKADCERRSKEQAVFISELRNKLEQCNKDCEHKRHELRKEVCSHWGN